MHFVSGANTYPTGPLYPIGLLDPMKAESVFCRCFHILNPLK